MQTTSYYVWSLACCARRLVPNAPRRLSLQVSMHTRFFRQGARHAVRVRVGTWEEHYCTWQVGPKLNSLQARRREELHVRT